ncbi:MAG: phytoene desaturase family protein [Myxococcales bacterium]
MSQQVIVIGAGFGGLAAAARLRAMGYRVTVLEAGSQPGGRARAFVRDGFHFDAGPTVITAPYLFDELFELFGKERQRYFELAPVDPFYRVAFQDGRQFDYVGDDERLYSQIAEFNPRDVDGYKKLVEHSRRIFDVGYTELVDADFSRFGDMMRIVPDLIRLRAYKSLYGLVAHYIQDDALRQVFTFQPLLIGGNPFRAPAIYLLIHWLERQWGIHFAMGGTAAIVRGLTQLLEEVGVEIRLDAPVERIEVAHGQAKGVLLSDGTFLEADLVVANADPAMVYTQLLDPAVRRKHSDAAIARKRYSMSLFVAYFGTHKTYPDLAHHSILLGPRYRELLTDIFDRKKLADDFSLYLHAPTRTDPSLAPAGSESFYVLSPVPNQQSGIDWSEEGPRYMDRILDALDAHHLPGLRENLATQFYIDPTYFEGELRSYRGAAFGLEPTLRQSAYFRFHNASEDVRGLYFVGAGVHPGAGLPGVLSSAKVLERVVPQPQTQGRALSLPKTVTA